jgi:hypothetical protein
VGDGGSNPGDIDPSGGDVAHGWPATSTPPPRQRFNWIENIVHRVTRYLRQRGVAEWHASETYPPSARTQHSTYMWQNVSGGNLTTTEPGTDSTKWLKCGHNESDMAVLLSNKMSFTAIPGVSANYDGVISSLFRYFVGGWVSGSTERVTVLAFKVTLGAGHNTVNITVTGGAAMFPTGQYHVTITPAGTNSLFYDAGSGTAGSDWTLNIQEASSTGGACWVRIEGYNYVP